VGSCSVARTVLVFKLMDEMVSTHALIHSLLITDQDIDRAYYKDF
jgi:hypothetical protein